MRIEATFVSLQSLVQPGASAGKGSKTKYDQGSWIAAVAACGSLWPWAVLYVTHTAPGGQHFPEEN
ncbi:MAG: hypothetical protein DMG06_25225 [Acidobacteria bacterium]|nr:MAG: hypothetical protein DMG06_25225 [Acidobacteriota bacterium]